MKPIDNQQSLQNLYVLSIEVYLSCVYAVEARIFSTIIYRNDAQTFITHCKWIENYICNGKCFEWVYLVHEQHIGGIKLFAVRCSPFAIRIDQTKRLPSSYSIASMLFLLSSLISLSSSLFHLSPTPSPFLSSSHPSSSLTHSLYLSLSGEPVPVTENCGSCYPENVCQRTFSVMTHE